MKVFIINLAKDVERKDSAIKECLKNNLIPEIISAVDGRLLSDDEKKKMIHPVLSEGLTPSELGCALSHYTIYKKMVDENIPLALVLEDDVELSGSINKVVDYISTLSHQDPTVFLLSEVNKYLPYTATKISTTLSMVNATQASRSHSYIINLNGAKKLSELLFPVWVEADQWTYFRELGAIKLKAILPAPGMLTELSETSTIWLKEEEEARTAIRNKRSEIFKAMRQKRPLAIKIKTALWKLFVRKMFESDRV